MRDNDLWAIVQKEKDIMPVLKLSYDQLPSYLKQCFAYCSLYRKDKMIDKWQLIDLWMAQGFIKSEEEQLEDIGERYINELVKRSFLEERSRGPNRESYIMHDLVHDLSQFIAGYECMKMDSAVKTISERLRHVSFDLSSYDPEPLFESKRLHTLLEFNSQKFNQGDPALSEKVASSFRYLRVLQLKASIVEIPRSICKLKHLRSLLIDTAFGMTIPETIGNLVNLQYLHLRIRWLPKVPMLELPKSIRKLVNLRYLSLYSTFLVCLPDEISGIGFTSETENFNGFALRISF